MLELILLLVFCVLLGVSSLGVIGWVLLSGAEIGIERIFLVHVSLLVAALFFGFAGWIAMQPSIRRLWKREATAKAASALEGKQEAAAEKAGKAAS